VCLNVRLLLRASILRAFPHCTCTAHRNSKCILLDTTTSTHTLNARKTTRSRLLHGTIISSFVSGSAMAFFSRKTRLRDETRSSIIYSPHLILIPTSVAEHNGVDAWIRTGVHAACSHAAVARRVIGPRAEHTTPSTRATSCFSELAILHIPELLALFEW
jgi:hypothetical protein